MQYKSPVLAHTIQLLLAGAVSGMPVGVLAQDDALPEVRVSALAIDEEARIVAPYSQLDEEQIFSRGGTLGELLSGLPGVHSDSFGGGASRPVLRGQTAPRVQVLSDSATLFDASDISPDHAVVTDPLLARRIEVLRGPATLLYGGGAIGGVVNILDDKIAVRQPDEVFSGSLALRSATVAREKAAALEVNAGLGEHLVLHLEGSRRDTDDYEAPGWPEPHVDGTYSDSENASAGLSWVGERGYLGLAYSYRNDQYGIPGHGHEYEDCHPHGSALHCGGHDDHDDGHDHDHDHAHDEAHVAPWIGLDSRRVDLRGELRQPLTGIHRIRIRGSHTDYAHDEIEAGTTLTNYRNRSHEGRIEIDHEPLFGWHGVIGAQFAETRFRADGVEAFLPATDSTTQGLFVVEHYDFNAQWHLEAGLRHERQQHEPVNDTRNRPDFDSDALSFSGALIWTFDDVHSLSVTVAEAQRLPHLQELYARGIHLATNTYECGLMPHPLTCGGADNNQALGRETSRNIDIALQRHSGALTWRVNLYHNAVDDYLYGRTLDQFEAFRLVKYTRQDATFHGLEAELEYRFSEVFSAGVFGDYVRGELDAGGNLPRMSPARLGARLQYAARGLDAEVEFIRVDGQDDIAAYEQVTPGYNLLNATLSYSPVNGEAYSVFLRGSNLLDDEIWNHSSFLASTIPLPGRNFSVGLSYRF